MSSPEPTSENPGAPRVTRENVMAKCDYFTRVQLWPLRSVLDPESWLKNFRPNEQDHAVHLLNSFMYFTPHLVHEMFAASVQALSRFVLQPGDSRITAQSAWSTFLGSAIIVPVAGETDNPSVWPANISGLPKGRLCLRLKRWPRSWLPPTRLYLLTTSLALANSL
jgi:hypothetical protein